MQYKRNMRLSKLMKPFVVSRYVAALMCFASLVTADAAVATASSGTPGDVGEGAGNKRPNIFLITIDALRPDRLGCYGYRKNTSPHIDELARRGVIFTNSFSQSSWTAPAMASMFVSKYPPSHGVRSFDQSLTFRLMEASAVLDGNPKMSPSYRVLKQDVLDESHATLAEVLREHGYNTAGFGNNDHLYRGPGFGQGFEVYVETSWILAEALNEKVFRFLHDSQEDKRPLFLWIHYVDPHAPYNLPVSYKELDKPFFSFWKFLKTELVTYDNEIRYTDEQMGLLIEELERLGLLPNVVFLITADHGEAFAEHWSKNHAYSLYNEEIRIPLIISSPLPIIPEGKRIESTVSAVDIMPTILDVLDIPIPEVHGQTLLPLINGSDDANRDIYAELKYRADMETLIKEVDGDLYKLILVKERDPTVRASLERNLRQLKDRIPQMRRSFWQEILEWWYTYRRLSRLKGERERHLYNLTRDPKEIRNLIDSKPEIAEQLEQALLTYSKLQPAETRKFERALSAEEAEKLKALGYLR